MFAAYLLRDFTTFSTPISKIARSKERKKPLFVIAGPPQRHGASSSLA